MGSTGYDYKIGDTQTVAVGEDAVPPTTEDGLPETIEDENGELLYFAYWDGDYTQVTEDREVFAIYTPLVTLITYDKTGNAPDEPNEMQLPCLTTPDLPRAKTLEDGYSTAWFMSIEGNIISDTPFELPCLEDTEISEYEFIYARYTVVPFTLLEDEETSYSENYTLICTAFVEDHEEIEDDEVIEEAEGNEVTGNDEVTEEAEGNEVTGDDEVIEGSEGNEETGNDEVIEEAEGNEVTGNDEVTEEAEGNEGTGDDGVIEGSEGNEVTGDNEAIEEEKEIHFRYSLFIQSPFDDYEMTAIDLQEYVFDPIYSDFPVMILNVPLGEWRFTITSDGEVSPGLPLAELVSMFENSGDTPLLISGAEAGNEPSDEEPILSDGE